MEYPHINAEPSLIFTALAPSKASILAMLWPFGRSRDTKPVPNAPVLAWLVPENTGAVGKYPVYNDISRIGRDPSNHICIDHDTVSSCHAELHRRRDGFFSIVDLNSTNGTAINGKESKNRVLRDQDLIELGEVRLRLLIAPGVSA